MKPLFSTDSQTLHSLEQELIIVTGYIEMQSIRWTGKFSYEINNDISEQQLQSIFIPKLSIQSLVENAFKYGLAKRRQEGSLHVNIELVGDYLHVVILDNGLGYENTQQQKDRSGRGNKILIKCLELLDKEHGTSGSYLQLRQRNLTEEYPGTETTLHCYSKYKKA